MRLALLLCLLTAACASPPANDQAPLEPANRAAIDLLTPGEAYARGIELRDANQLDHALLHIQSAAERGHAEAQFELGLWYMTARGVPEDFVEAARWVELAAAQGQADGLVYIWQLYFYGKGVVQSDTEALKWLRRGAPGNPMLAYHLGLFLYEGIGTGADRAQAALWFTEAADKGIAGACYYLGVMQLEGDSVARNDEQAFKRFEQSARQGHAPGMLAMGDCYRDGRGVKASDYEARRWYRRALEQDTDLDVREAARQRLQDLEAGDRPE